MHPRFTFNQSERIRLVSVALAPWASVTLTGALVIAALAQFSSASGPGYEPVNMAGLLATAEQPEGNNANDEIEAELITIRPTGFEPTEFTRPAGKFLLDVDNRSEIEEVELHLDRQGGGREKSARVRSTAPEWRGALDLRPGVYILREANHSNWICRITITAN